MFNPLDLNLVNLLLFLHQNHSSITCALRKCTSKFKYLSFLKQTKYSNKVCCIYGLNRPL